MKLPLNIDVQQILLHMLNFVLLFGGLYFILYNPVKKFMDERKKGYEDIDAKANKALEDAKKSQEEYAKKLSSAKDEIDKMKQSSFEEASAEAKRIIESAQKQSDEIVEKARKTAEYEKEESIKNANREISKLAVLAAQKVVFESTKDSYDAFLGSVKEAENGGK